MKMTTWKSQNKNRSKNKAINFRRSNRPNKKIK